MYRLYTDGACKGNPGKGGWAYLLKRDEVPGFSMEQRGGEAHTTNNRMELRAVIEGLKSTGILDYVEVTTDSTYVIAVAKSPKHPYKLKNPELVTELRELIRGRHVTFHHVLGHNGHPENEYVDRLASAGAQQQVGFASAGT
jgi:ribonuclease HI